MSGIVGTEHGSTRWEDEVRDPATQAAEPAVRFRAAKTTASYELAPIPSGWAWRAEYALPGGSCGGSPWRGPYATRQEAIADACRYLIHGIHRTSLALAERIRGAAAQPELVTP